MNGAGCLVVSCGDQGVGFLCLYLPFQGRCALYTGIICFPRVLGMYIILEERSCTLGSELWWNTRLGSTEWLPVVLSDGLVI